MLTLLYHAYLGARRLLDVSARLPQDRDERYLAESADIYDLERRMRQLDAGQSQQPLIGSSGLFSQ